MADGLFRGKRVDNGEWVEGCYVYGGTNHYIVVRNDLSNQYIEVVPETVGKLLKIKNIQYGEGDVVEATVSARGKRIYGVIRFGEFYVNNEDKYTGFYISWRGEDSEWYKKSIAHWAEIWGFKIVGNIHDNPELFKEE